MDMVLGGLDVVELVERLRELGSCQGEYHIFYFCGATESQAVYNRYIPIMWGMPGVS